MPQEVTASERKNVPFFATKERNLPSQKTMSNEKYENVQKRVGKEEHFEVISSITEALDPSNFLSATPVNSIVPTNPIPLSSVMTLLAPNTFVQSHMFPDENLSFDLNAHNAGFETDQELKFNGENLFEEDDVDDDDVDDDDVIAFETNNSCINNSMMNFQLNNLQQVNTNPLNSLNIHSITSNSAWNWANPTEENMPVHSTSAPSQLPWSDTNIFSPHFLSNSVSIVTN